MSERKDLTRWNRAGLSRFRYVDGNAVEYLEILRQQLVERFADPETKLCGWLKPAEQIPADEKAPENATETLIQRQKRLNRRQERLLAMYDQERRDWAWEITRTFARACHILTEHTNAYANEGYLGTATQWDNVRRLVEMLGYHPAPPASAYTRLVLTAKENKKGTVKKGDKVQYTPETGGPKVIFETLEDLEIDSTLNGLRPKGWDRSDEPAVGSVPSGNNGSKQPPAEEEQFSTIANGPAINLQGVGKTWASQLNETLSDNKFFKIKDFRNLNPEDSKTKIGVTMLRELKAKATAISNFEMEAGWSKIADWSLPRIASESPEALAEITGQPLDNVKALQLKIELIGAYLDHPVYKNAKLKELLTPATPAARSRAGGEPGSVPTSWRAKRNPKVIPGQIAMIYREFRTENEGEYFDEAEAATIAGIEKQTEIIHLIPSSVQNNWTTKWTKGEARLKVSPRWKRKCWLNGSDVIRTVEPHGLSAKSYIGWKKDYDLEIVELVDEGRSLVNVVLVGEANQLYIGIFDEKGDKVVDKKENAKNVKDELLGRAAIDALKSEIKRLRDAPLSPEAKQNIIEKAISCARYTQWRYAKVLEADTRALRLEATGPMPQEGVELYELRPIEGSVFPADFDAIGLPGGEDAMPPAAEGVPPMSEKPPKTDDPEPIFCLRNVLPGEMKSPGGEGGGLLPPASLPEIGCFLFPSPMLPMDLVKAAVELMLSIGVMAIPSTGDIVIKGMPFGGLLQEAGTDADAAAAKLFDMLNNLEGVVQEQNDNCEPLWDNNTAEGTTENPDGTLAPLIERGDDEEPKTKKLVVWNKSLKANPSTPVTPKEKDAITGKLKSMLISEGKEATVLFQRLTEDITGRGPLLAIPKKTSMVKAVVQASEPLYMFDGSSKIGVGDWVVSEFSDGLKALRVSNIYWYTDSDKTETFSLSFEQLDGDKELKKVYADFRGELIAEGASVNTTKISSDEIELDNVPESLKVGRTVLLTAEGEEPVAAKIEDINRDTKTITTNPPATGFTKGELIIRGNVVPAGHGESKPEIILGSGDAAKSNQEFTLAVEKISFTPDATKSSGVAAAIDVEVAGRIWEQVSTLKDSAPGDHHYAIRMTENGYVRILFGDGEYGRRLPSGNNNIRVRYRVGSGLAGNVPAGSLEKPVNPHPLIDTVRQPLQAAGGGDMEDVAALRENAPATLLALERAVSLSDFSNLAAAHSSVWQAKAYRRLLHGGRTQSIKVVIVPADGVSSPEIGKAIQSFLQKQALPGIQVTVENFSRILFRLKVTVRVRYDAFIAAEVEQTVASALADHFSLKNRKLGEHLYQSEVFKIVESIRGVENSICVLNDDSNLSLIRAGDERTVIYLDTRAGSTLTVTAEEYQP